MLKLTQPPRGSMGIGKAASFTGGYSHGGDTQPVDSQVYHRYTESMRDETTSTTPRKQHSMAGTTPETLVTDQEHTPQLTLQPGQAGYVDLDGMWQERPVSPATSFANYDELLVGDGIKSPDTQFYQPHRPNIPETPALAGQKHGRDGEPLTSVTTATRFSQILPHGAVMGATQLFAQTQEHSSQFANTLPSDDAMSRPSPNTNGAEANNASSPRTLLSSPFMARHIRSSPGIGEPRAQYTSMKESQEQRERRTRERLQHEKGLGEIGSDSDDDTQERRFRAKQLRRSKSEQALKEAARVSAPPRGVHLLSSTRKSVVDLVTPATIRRKVSFDEILEEAEEDELQAALPEDSSNDNDEDCSEDDEHAAKQQEEDDQYDELQEKVIRSQSNFQGNEDDDDHNGSIVGSIQENDVESPDNDEPLEDTQNPDGKGTVIEDNDQEDPREEEHNTQRSTIADSQPLGQISASNAIPSAPLHHSSMASFIPGSQYTGRTSQDQAFLKLSHPSQIRVVASQVNEVDKVSSSPPLPKLAAERAAHSPNPSHAHKRPEAQSESASEESATPQEVPESDAANQVVQAPLLESRSIGLGEDESTNHIPFSTAQTHVSASARSPAKSFTAPSPLKAFRSQQNETPRKAFRDMIDGPQKMNGSFDFDDVDDIMAGVMTKEDEEVLDAISSPGSKRRKTYYSSSISSRLHSGHAQPEQRVHANKDIHENTMTGSNRTTQDSEADLARPALRPTGNVQRRAEGVNPVDSLAASEIEGTIPESEPDHPPAEAQETVLRDSLSKANVLPTACPQQESQKQRTLTPDSAEQREDAGSRHASQLISTTRLRESASRKRKLKTFGRAARRHEIRTQKASKKTTARADQRRTGGVDEEKPDQDDDAEDATEEAEVIDEINRTDATPPPAERIHRAPDEPGLPSLEDDLLDDAVAQQLSGGSFSAPERVWALFKGTPPNFYPATWIGSGPDGMTYKVQFDDKTVTSIDTWHVRTLTLRIGDQVKVDNGLGSRSKIWKVTGFNAATGVEHGRGLCTDTFGHTHVKVQAATSRQSVAKDGAAADNAGEIREVLISDLYLTNGMWKHYKDREFSPPATAKPMSTRPATPSSRLQTPDTPTSRSRRNGIPNSKSKNMGSSHLRDVSATFSTSAATAPIFSGMAFAITYKSGDAEKARITRMILRNGGIILDEGFAELFDIPNIGQPEASPSKSPRKDMAGISDKAGLHLKSKYVDYGFVALIADRHSRRAKYMQALALDLPTLSGRWIIDSLNEEKNSSLRSRQMAPLPWGQYLLPAGESSFLDGAIRSRVMLPYDASSSQLRITVKSRPMLLNGEGVLIVAPKKDKAAWERRRTYAFLTFALGAGTVERVNDLQDAKSMIQANPHAWKWIYVDGKIDEAFSKLCGKVAGGNKRKHGSGAVLDDGAKLSVTNGDVTVVNDEFVVQSLILGALAD